MVLDQMHIWFLIATYLISIFIPLYRRKLCHEVLINSEKEMISASFFTRVKVSQ